MVGEGPSGMWQFAPCRPAPAPDALQFGRWTAAVLVGRAPAQDISDSRGAAPHPGEAAGPERPQGIGPMETAAETGIATAAADGGTMAGGVAGKLLALGGPAIWIKRDDCTGLACGGNIEVFVEVVE